MAWIIGGNALALVLHICGFYLLASGDLPAWAAIAIVYAIFIVVAAVGVAVSGEARGVGELAFLAFALGIGLPGLIPAFFFIGDEVDTGHVNWAEVFACLALYAALFHTLALFGFALELAIVAAVTLLVVQLVVLVFSPMAVRTPAPERQRRAA